MTRLMPRLHLLAAACAALGLAGCESLPTSPRVDVVEPTAARPAPMQAATVSNGSIYQSTQYRPLFEDHRARLVGDTITVQIVENVTATASSTNTVEKTGSVNASITAAPFLGAALLGKLGAGGSSANKTAGKGDTQNSNTFTGTITATVIEVLPNGHLVVSGEKQIGVNHNTDVLRFSGQIDPRAIQPGNTVPSAQIANVRLEQRGRGAAADAQQTGWLARFFLSVLPI
jgi:flagellar L-ring protein precursor FlgH